MIATTNYSPTASDNNSEDYSLITYTVYSDSANCTTGTTSTNTLDLSWSHYSRTAEVDKIAELFKSLMQSARRHQAQWMLRKGYKIKLDPPVWQLAPIPIIINRRMLRCNRRGIGLRINNYLKRR